MLFKNKDNYEYVSDFDEINDNLATMQSLNYQNYQKNDKKEDDILPWKTRLFLFLSGFAYIGLLLISIIVAVVFTFFVTDKNLLNVLVQTFTYVGLLAVLIAIIFKYKDKFIPLLKNATGYLYGLLFGIVTLVAEIALSTIIYSIYQAPTNSNQVIIEEMMNSYPTLMFFVTVIIGPICEELTYRVGLFGLLRKKNEILAFIISSIVFGLIHISFIEADLVAEFVALPIYIAIGALLTCAYKKYGFTCCFVAHALVNLASFAITIFL